MEGEELPITKTERVVTSHSNYGSDLPIHPDHSRLDYGSKPSMKQHEAHCQLPSDHMTWNLGHFPGSSLRRPHVDLIMIGNLLLAPEFPLILMSPSQEHRRPSRVNLKVSCEIYYHQTFGFRHLEVQGRAIHRPTPVLILLLPESSSLTSISPANVSSDTDLVLRKCRQVSTLESRCGDA